MADLTVEEPLTPSARGGRAALGEVAGLTLKLGFTAFGGPAAHIAMLRDEVVARRRWVSDEYFLDLIGATNLIPGPNSTEMIIHTSYIRAGWRGLLTGGTLFITPAALIVLAFAWAYVRFGSTPEVSWLLYGIKPVIIAVVVQALWNLGRTGLKSLTLAAIGLAVVALYLVGINELVLLFGGALVALVVALGRRAVQRPPRVTALVPLAGLGWPVAAAAPAAVPFSLLQLFLVFLKIGAVLYGSGYVLLAFLRTDLVERLGWLSDKQLLDAVAIGQLTPGPVFTTATFVGYVTGGFAGAALATLGIFLPSFAFVALLHPLVPRLRRSPWTAALLDGINVAALGLMAGVTWQLGRAAVVDLLTALLAVMATVLLIRFRVNSAWLVLGGGLVGVVWRFLT